MDARRKAGWVWDETTIKEYVTDSRMKVAGSKMLFPRVTDMAERTIYSLTSAASGRTAI